MTDPMQLQLSAFAWTSDMLAQPLKADPFAHGQLSFAALLQGTPERFLSADLASQLHAHNPPEHAPTINLNRPNTGPAERLSAPSEPHAASREALRQRPINPVEEPDRGERHAAVDLEQATLRPVMDRPTEPALQAVRTLPADDLVPLDRFEPPNGSVPVERVGRGDGVDVSDALLPLSQALPPHRSDGLNAQFHVETSPTHTVSEPEALRAEPSSPEVVLAERLEPTQREPKATTASAFIETGPLGHARAFAPWDGVNTLVGPLEWAAPAPSALSGLRGQRSESTLSDAGANWSLRAAVSDQSVLTYNRQAIPAPTPGKPMTAGVHNPSAQRPSEAGPQSANTSHKAQTQALAKRLSALLPRIAQTSAVRVAIGAGEAGLSVMARIERMSEAERVRLQRTIETVMAEHGLNAASITITGRSDQTGLTR